jgi:hypothetical protein
VTSVIYITFLRSRYEAADRRERIAIVRQETAESRGMRAGLQILMSVIYLIYTVIGREERADSSRRGVGSRELRPESRY